MKKNGAMFFEIYYDETDTSIIEINNGSIESKKKDAQKGVSVRVFDGQKHLFVTTDDLSESNLRNLINHLTRQITKRNPAKQFLYEDSANVSVLNIEPPYNWNDLGDSIIRTVTDEHAVIQECSSKDVPVKTKCYIQNQRIQLLSSYNGIIYDNRSKCCIKTDVGVGQTVRSHILTPTSIDNFFLTVKTEGLISIPKMEKRIIKDCPSGIFDIVLLSGSASLFFHECCGHPLEIYNAVQRDSIFNGKLGKKIASNCVTLVDNGNLKDLWGSISVDDEGNSPKENVLIQDGILVGYLSDLVQGYKYNVPPTSTTRRQSYKFMPVARMTNTFIAKGNCKEDDIIQNTHNGLLIHSFHVGRVNPITGDFQVNIASGRFIINGVVGDLFYGGTICANALDVLSHIDMVADNVSFSNGFCYAPSGRIPVSGGQPTLRIRSVPVYSKYH